MTDSSGTAGAVGLPTLACLTVSSALLAALSTYALLRLTFNSPQHEDAKPQQDGACRPGKAAQQEVARSSHLLPPLDMTAVKAHIPALEARRMNPYDPSPRTGYLQWDDYFMALAFLSAQRSKDPSKQVGAVIVGANKVILSIGYNGFPRGCPDSALPWAKLPPAGTKDPLATKYPYVVHAEANALLNKNTASTSGASIYVTMFPCNECAKLLIQAGITEVIYHEDKVQEKVAGEAPGVTGEAQAGTSYSQASCNGTYGSSAAADHATGSEVPCMNGSGPAQTSAAAMHTGSGVCQACNSEVCNARSCSIHLSSCCCSQDCASPGPLSHTISSSGCVSARCSSGGAGMANSKSAQDSSSSAVHHIINSLAGGCSQTQQVPGAKRDLSKESALDDACYMASKRLLQMAGVRLRQHKLQRLILLGPPPVL